MQVSEKPANRTFEIRVKAVADGVTEARRALATHAEKAGADRQAVELAVSEAVANAVVHGYPNGRKGEVIVRATVIRRQLVVDVSDDGDGMRPNPESPGLGLGLPLIGRVTDAFTITEGSRGGTMVSMRFRVAA
jgi:serine/threonine-protein kinase RsbW